jgi:tryptophan 2,3-dioxygenase
MDDPSLTYSTYLMIDDLLSLQRPRSDGPEHDELLFIVIHQVYELWFKQVLHELDHTVDLLDADEQIRCSQTLNRVLRILKVMVSQMDVLETMTPLEFLSFRDRLESGSGFQSAQFRELEFLLGAKNPAAVERAASNSAARERLERRLAAPSLWDAFLAHLGRRGFTERPVQEALLTAYRTDRSTGALCERLIDLDEGLQEWRYRHVKMVERTIGTKQGTGGSLGAGYLHTTLGHPVFPDLWAIRARF